MWCASVLFRALVFARKQLYELGIFTVYSSDIPVIVIGNITVGGTGKTPLLIGIAKYLQSQGYCPAVVSRGYGGKKQTTPVFVKADAAEAASSVGDEPLLIAKKTNLPVAVCQIRHLAVNAICRRGGVDVILSDDGLQHYQMHRDIEVVCVDGERKFGNGLCLPAGPLREPLSRLQSVDFIISKSIDETAGDSFELVGQMLVSLGSPETTKALSEFANQRVHAVAGIANPESFFGLLRSHKLVPTEQAFPDHHAFVASDFQFDEILPVIMTEKDAVKCAGLGLDNAWYLPVEIKFHSNFPDRLESALKLCIESGKTKNGA
jgi:tetraacyldisaccharide 4'-kinase